MLSQEPELHIRLALDHPDRDKAVAELRLLLLKGLSAGLGRSHSVNESFIEDMVQASLLRILDHLSSFAGRSQFSTWALSVAMRVAFTELRRKHWNDVSLDQLRENNQEQPQEETSPDAAPHLLAEKVKIVQLMKSLIKTELTDRQRDVLEAELNGMPQDEVARQLGTNRNAIYKLSHDARKALKRCLERANYRAEDIRELFAA